MRRIKKRYIIFCFLGLIGIGLLVPDKPIIPVKDATAQDWNKKSFWAYPWGKSGTHKGIDIFVPWGQEVVSATNGIVLYSGELGMGGLVIAILGPKWKIHYYAHLRTNSVKTGAWVKKGTIIGGVGTTGNAAGKPPHLHYSITTLIPYLWRWDDAPQGWKKIFYLNPDKELP